MSRLLGNTVYHKFIIITTLKKQGQTVHTTDVIDNSDKQMYIQNKEKLSIEPKILKIQTNTDIYISKIRLANLHTEKRTDTSNVNIFNIHFFVFIKFPEE